jgi:hypothetical protein
MMSPEPMVFWPASEPSTATAVPPSSKNKHNVEITFA